MAALRSMHCIHCGQTYLNTELEKCSLCRKSGGLVEPSSAEAQQATQALNATLVPPLPPRASTKRPHVPCITAKTNDLAGGGLDRALLVFRIVKLSFGGLGCIGLGTMLLSTPSMYANPREPTFADMWPGIGAIIAGIIMLGLVGFTLYQFVRSLRRDG